jgi:hypothetical protein
LQQLKFTGVEKVEQKEGEVWVWVNADMRELKIAKEGYAMLPFVFPVRLEKNTVYALKLKSSQSLVVNIKTPGLSAVVRVNGKEYPTNIPFEGLSEGEFDFEIYRLGYYPIKRKLKVDARNNVYSFTLQRTRKSSFSVTTEPGQCDLYIEDKLVGKTPHTGMYFPDVYRVSIRKSKYKTIDTTLQFDPEKNTNFHFTLTDNLGWVEVNASPRGALVMIDGVLVKSGKLQVEAGVNHELTVSKSMYTTHKETFVVDKNQTISKQIELSVAQASFSMASLTPEVKVKLQSKEAGTLRWKGNKTVNLQPGRYTLNLSKKGYEPTKQTLWIKEGEAKSFTSALNVHNVSATTALKYSIFVPGRGQIYAQRKVAGYFYMGATVSLLSATIYYNNIASGLGDTYQEAIEDYEDEWDPNEIDQKRLAMDLAYDDYIKVAQQRNKFMWATIGVYALNVIDAVIFANFYNPGKKRNMDVGYIPVKDGGVVSMRMKF